MTTVYRYHPTNRYKHDARTGSHMGKRQQIGGNASRRFDERVTCLICNKSYLALNTHVPTHNIKIVEYRAKFHLTSEDTISKDLRERKSLISKRNYLNGKVDLIKLTHSKAAQESRKKYWDNGGREAYSNRMKWLAKEKWATWSEEIKTKILTKMVKHQKDKWNELEQLKKNCIMCGKEIRPLKTKDGKKHIDSINRFMQKKHCSNCSSHSLKPHSKEHKKALRESWRIKLGRPKDYDRNFHWKEVSRQKTILKNIL